MRTRALVQVIAAVTVLGVSTYGMLLRVEPFASWYYPLAWWPYIFGVDALILAIQGHSMLSRCWREFFFLAAISVPLWLIFELWNLALKNWYYINLTPCLIARWVGYAVSYATVLPALFETAELVGALGLFREVRVRPLRVGPRLYHVFWLAGGLSLLLPLIVPRYFFPLIWLAFTFLLEPFNHRWARRSLLREWEEGSIGTLLRLLLAGMLCGLLWESFNFWALTKWIYTVPFFEEFKLFEMPLAGFFGFPPFAVECYVIVQFVGIFRGGRGWEPGDERPVGRPLLRPFLSWGLIGILTVFSLGMFSLLDRFTVNSLHPHLAALHDLAPEEVSALRKAGVERLDVWILREEGRLPLEGQTGLPPEALRRWRRIASLCALMGIGVENMRLLWEAGVTSVRDLAGEEPESLAVRLRAIQRDRGWARQPPRNSQVRLWVRGARRICRGGHKIGGVSCQ